MFRLATCDFFSRGLGLRHCGRGSAAPCGRRLRPCGRPRQKTHLAAVFFFTLVASGLLLFFALRIGSVPTR